VGIQTVDLRAPSLADVLDRFTVEGRLYGRLPGDKVVCYACGHRCTIFPGRRGICKVRFNDRGALRVPWGYVAALQCDPTEKKPFYHVLPGSLTLTFGMLGCDLHCSGCQNWLTSQTLRDPSAGVAPEPADAGGMIHLARRHGAQMVGSSYNEPLITSEWACEIFREAKDARFRTCYVSNGNATREVLEYLRPWIDCFKIDLKAFTDTNYRSLGGKLGNILETVKLAHALGFWMEIVTLVIPGFNDGDDELRATAGFIASVSPLVPWHVTAFHGDYKMTRVRDTPVATLLRAAQIGEAAGLKYVYAGNRPGRTGRYEHTFCHHCRTLLVERHGYLIVQDRLSPQGRCPDCGTAIPGIWQ
jgi:pyruvate formate lyase activating enzyme